MKITRCDICNENSTPYAVLQFSDGTSEDICQLCVARLRESENISLTTAHTKLDTLSMEGSATRTAIDDTYIKLQAHLQKISHDLAELKRREPIAAGNWNEYVHAEDQHRMTVEGRINTMAISLNKIAQMIAAKEGDNVGGQLPFGMEHCTILYEECEKGHGWLTAKNWIQHPCQKCEIDRLKAELDRYSRPIARGET